MKDRVVSFIYEYNMTDFTC